MKKTISTLAAALALSITLLMATEKPTDNSKQSEEDLAACALPSHAETTALDAFKKSEKEWQATLSPEQYHVMRKHGTEPAFRNALWNNKKEGVYLCAACEAPLFASSHKYDSGTGWPSFWDTIAKENIGTTVDTSYNMTRTEVHCHRCGGHLGHVFEDGPRPTRLRYCINSASLEFVEKEDLADRELASYLPKSK